MLAKSVGVGAAILVLVLIGRWTAAPRPVPIVRSVPALPRSQTIAESVPTGSSAPREPLFGDDHIQPPAESVPASNSAEIRSDLAAVETQIKRTEEEDVKYSGGLVKALIGSELHIFRQTRAMLQQRATSWTFGIGLSFQVNGKPYIPPANAPELLASVEQEIAATRIKLASAEAEADRYSGGLVQALSLSTVATIRNSLAMLEQHRLALKYNLPQYIGFQTEPGGSQVDATVANTPIRSQAETPKANVFEIVSIDARPTEMNDVWWRYGWKLTVRNLTEETRRFTATIEFEDRDGFIIDSDSSNHFTLAPRQEDTVTGSKLVSMPGAAKVARYEAKVGR